MKKLIMMGIFALGTITASASNKLGSIFKNDINSHLNEQSEFGCYTIIGTTWNYNQNFLFNPFNFNNWNLRSSSKSNL